MNENRKASRSKRQETIDERNKSERGGWGGGDLCIAKNNCMKVNHDKLVNV